MRFKKQFTSFLVVIFMLTTLFSSVSAQTNSTAVSVNNQVISGGPGAIYADGTILVPANEFVSAMGGTFSYSQPTLSAAVKLGENELVYRLDNNVAKFNGKYVQAPQPLKIAGSRFMIPAEFTAKQLGAETYIHTWKNILLVFQPVNGKLTYQVMSGDTLWIISSIFSVPISTIKQLNGLTGDTLYVGQKLIIKDFSPFNIILPAQTRQNGTIYSGTSFSSGVVGYIQSLIDISVVGKSGDWYKVMTPKGNGYLYNSVVTIKQELSDTAPNSKYFAGQIPVDTSKNTVTYNSYTVKWGDSVWSIAIKFGLPDYELAQANGISPTATLYNGQIIKVPVHNVSVKDTSGPQYGELMDWFKEAQYVFPINKEGVLRDILTGKSFKVKRTMGANHADTETLTAEDTKIMKEIFGGYWTWNRRSFILEVDGRRLAVSVAGMPHAGVDGAPYLQNVSNRSDNWGYGPNYDAISGNGMSGHFDLYFLNCLRHKDNAMDPAHQYQVMVSGGLR